MATDHISIVEHRDIYIAELLDQKLFKLDHEMLDDIATTLLEFISTHTCPQLLIDFGNTQTICSTMLGILIRAKKRVAEKGGRIALCSLQPLPRKLITLCGLEVVFDIYPNRQAAIDELNTP